MSGKASQAKGKRGEIELVEILQRAGHPVVWGGSQTYGTTPDISGLEGIHVECKRVERLNLGKAMDQAERDAAFFHDGAPAVFHRQNRRPWLVTMRLEDWLELYRAEREKKGPAKGGGIGERCSDPRFSRSQ